LSRTGRELLFVLTNSYIYLQRCPLLETHNLRIREVTVCVLVASFLQDAFIFGCSQELWRRIKKCITQE
jgi:hypothetical protein